MKNMLVAFGLAFVLASNITYTDTSIESEKVQLMFTSASGGGYVSSNLNNFDAYQIGRFTVQ